MAFRPASTGPLWACFLIALSIASRAAGDAPRIERLPPVASAAADEVALAGYDDEVPLMTPPSSVASRAHDGRTWQVLPDGLMYKSYLAGVKEPRFASQWVNERTGGQIWDIAIGGRVGILRHGTRDPLEPEGWQVDLEGAAFPRIDVARESDLVACDYRMGIPLTHAEGPHHYKIGYYHISSHLGDEWILRYPGQLRRINYVRDSILVGYSYYWRKDFRFYGETACALGSGEGTEPWEFQFGVEYSPAKPTGLRPVPFVAVNGHLREEVDFGGNVTVQSGWQWRGATGHLLRMGMHCYVGMSDQYEFYDEYESKVGFGIWYDY